MISTMRTVAAAATAALALAGGAAVVGSTAAADDVGPAPRVPTAARALVSSCDGGAAMSVHRRATDFQNVAAGTTADLEGSAWTVKGPTKGTDVLLVTISSMASSGGSGELTSLALYKDGVGTTEGSKYFTYNGILDQATTQFCVKLPKGSHSFVVKVTDGGGGGTTLYYPVITYQRYR